LNTSLTWNVMLEGVGQKYHDPSIDALVHFGVLPGSEDGYRVNGNFGLTWRIDSRSTLATTVGFETKAAGYEPFEYNAPYIDANYHALLGSGAYFDLSGDARYVAYRAPDPVFLLGTERADVRSDVRAALGAPLSAFSDAGATGDFRENLILEGAVSFADRTTRYPVAPFHSLGGELRMVWKFGDRQ